MDRPVIDILKEAVSRAERRLQKAKTTSEKHYARREIERAQEDLASLDLRKGAD